MNAAPRGNKAGAASSGAGFKATDSVSRGLPNNRAVAAPSAPHRTRIVLEEEYVRLCHQYAELMAATTQLSNKVAAHASVLLAYGWPIPEVEGVSIRIKK